MEWASFFFVFLFLIFFCTDWISVPLTLSPGAIFIKQNPLNPWIRSKGQIKIRRFSNFDGKIFDRGTVFSWSLIRGKWSLNFHLPDPLIAVAEWKVGSFHSLSAAAPHSPSWPTVFPVCSFAPPSGVHFQNMDMFQPREHTTPLWHQQGRSNLHCAKENRLLLPQYQECGKATSTWHERTRLLRPVQVISL